MNIGQTAPTPAVDLEDPSGCLIGEACEVCGDDLGESLGIAVAYCEVGVLCLTLCDYCLEQGEVPTFAVTEAAGRVGTHCEHLGIDLDQMDASLQQQRRGQPA